MKPSEAVKQHGLIRGVFIKATVKMEGVNRDQAYYLDDTISIAKSGGIDGIKNLSSCDGVCALGAIILGMEGDMERVSKFVSTMALEMLAGDVSISYFPPGRDDMKAIEKWNDTPATKQSDVIEYLERTERWLGL
jgi:hypothetical protein